MKHSSAAIAAVALVAAINLVFAATAVAKCDPGRPSHVATREWGSYKGVQPGVKFYQIRAFVENDAIPYVESSTSEARITLRNPSESGPGGSEMFVGLVWTRAQTALSLTGLRV